jgi:hypothetical protein
MHVNHFMMKLPIALLFIFIAFRRHRNHGAVNATGKVARVGATLLFIALLGFAGCTNADPLAVASGPVFALNAGQWQPAPQDLAAPPVVVKQ